MIPEYRGNLRNHGTVEIPRIIETASGIRVFGRLLRSLLFSTDVALIKNTNADSVIAVYPFTPQPAITQAVLTAADMPVFAGVGGGITRGKRVVELALHAEHMGAIGVVVNAPTDNETISELKKTIDIPVVLTVVSEFTDFAARRGSGADIFNVSCADQTPRVVNLIRELYPNVPIIATGGPNEDAIARTIAAGANAITWTPPTTAELFKKSMSNYRTEHSGAKKI